MEKAEGIKCPECGHRISEVIDSRSHPDGLYIRRRRSCQKCKAKHTTYETSSNINLVSFNKNKVFKEFQKLLRDAIAEQRG